MNLQVHSLLTMTLAGMVSRLHVQSVLIAEK